MKSVCNQMNMDRLPHSVRDIVQNVALLNGDDDPEPPADLMLCDCKIKLS